MRVLVQEAAEQDILSQFEWYAAQGLADIARGFRASSYGAIEAVTAMPHAGTPRLSRNPTLTGLRSWLI